MFSSRFNNALTHPLLELKVRGCVKFVNILTINVTFIETFNYFGVLKQKSIFFFGSKPAVSKMFAEANAFECKIIFPGSKKLCLILPLSLLFSMNCDL